MRGEKSTSVDPPRGDQHLDENVPRALTLTLTLTLTTTLTLTLTLS